MNYPSLIPNMDSASGAKIDIQCTPVQAYKTFIFVHSGGREDPENFDKNLYLGTKIISSHMVYASPVAKSHMPPRVENKAGIYAYSPEKFLKKFMDHGPQPMVYAKVNLERVIIEHTDGILRADTMRFDEIYLPDICLEDYPATHVIFYLWHMPPIDEEKQDLKALAGEGMKFIDGPVRLAFPYSAYCSRCRTIQHLYEFHRTGTLLSYEQLAAIMSRRYNATVRLI